MLPTINPKEIPAGFDYQWATLAVAGDENLGDYQRMREGGWRAVPYSRHPNCEKHKQLMMSFGPAGTREFEERIVVGDLILIERPKIITTQSRAIEKRAADEQIEPLRRRDNPERKLPATNALHWWPRLKFQLRRPVVWAVGAIWRWWRK